MDSNEQTIANVSECSANEMDLDKRIAAAVAKHDVLRA